jgi:glycine/D-amino acid oxidase-like deaminating enzyme
MNGSVVVVGAGVLGATLAHRLTVDGWQVTVLDLHDPGTPLGSSGGASRLVRCAHGDSADDALGAWESLELWRQIEAETGVALLTQTGVAWFAGDDDEWHRASHAVLQQLAIPVEIVSAADARSLFPELCVDDLRYLLYEPEASLIAAAAAQRALIDDAVRRGATFTRAPVTRDGVGVISGGRRLAAVHVVWAVGCWTAQVFPELLKASVIQQDTYYYGAGCEWSSPPVPAWGDLGAGITGAGSLAGAGVKLGLHEAGPAVALDGPRVADPELGAHARAYLARRFPSLADAPVSQVEVQHTAEVEWVAGVEPVGVVGGVRIVRDPSAPSVSIIGDGSGSVYKTAPRVAARAAELILSA